MHKPTLRYMILNDLYRPLDTGELAASEMLSPAAASALDAGKIYGSWTWKKRKQTKRPDREDSRVNRYETERRPRAEWQGVAVELSESGLSRSVVDAARERIASNTRRPPSTAAARFWVLSGGLARCAECGSVLSSQAYRRQSGNGDRFYYRCRQRFTNGTRTCTNNRSNPAAPLEEAVWNAVRWLLADPERLAAEYEAYLSRRRQKLRGDPDARDLTRRLQALDEERRGYLRQNARGVLSDSGLDEMLVEVDEQRETLRRALGELHERRRALERLETERELAHRQFVAMAQIDLRNASPEHRRKVLQALQITATVDAEGNVRISGVLDGEERIPGYTESLPMKNAPANETYKVHVSGEIPEPHKGTVTLDTTRTAA